jgi:GDP-mannose 4,6-dehydratase
MKGKHLITGITGMVGSHLLDYLVENTDEDIIGICRWRSPLNNIKNHLDKANSNNSRIIFDYGDLNDLSSLIRIISKYKPTFIYHLAAQSYPQTSFTAPIDTLNTNIIGTMNLLEAIRLCEGEDNSYKPKIHICSSSEVFGRVPKSRVPIVEDELFHPASPYAISKAGTDLIGRYYGEAFGMKTVVTRMFTHTGPRRGDVFAESSFAKQIALIEKNHIEPIIRVGNLESLRTYADVRDAVKAYFMLINSNYANGEYFNIGGSYTCTVGDMLNTLISMSTYTGKIQIVVEEKRLRPIDADLQVPCIDKFVQHTGWRPEIAFEKTMKDLLDYWRCEINNLDNHLVR